MSRAERAAAAQVIGGKTLSQRLEGYAHEMSCDTGSAIQEAGRYVPPSQQEADLWLAARVIARVERMVRDDGRE